MASIFPCITFGIFTFLSRFIWMPLRLAPKDWTAVTLQFSPALGSEPDGEENGSEALIHSLALPGPQPQGSHVQDVSQVAAAVPALRAIVQERCPSLADSINPDHYYRPTTYLASGHLQTIYSAFRKTIYDDPIHYRRRALLTPDGGTLTIDVAPPTLAKNNHEDKTPTFIVVTGLTGGSAETYVRHVVRPLVEEKKWRAVVMNYRGCAHTPVTSGQLYSASKTSDLATAVLFCQQNWPQSPLVAVGFSLGANVLAKYLGECGNSTPLRGGLTVAGPYDLTAGSNAMEASWFNKNVYSKTMCGNLTRVFLRQGDVMSLSYQAKVQLDRLTETREVVKAQALERGTAIPYSLRWFDDNATRVVGGYQKPHGEFPFSDAWAYYRGGSAVNVLHRVARPMLAIHARDDPVVPYRCAEAVAIAMGAQAPHPDWDKNDPCRPAQTTVLGKGNPNLVLASTEYGGHLGWWSHARPTRWLKAPAIEWLSALIEAPECGKLQLPPNPHVSGGTQVTPVKVDVFPHSVLRPYVPAAVRKPQDANVQPANGDQLQEASVEQATQAVQTTQADVNKRRAPVDNRLPKVGNDRIAFLTTPVLSDTQLLHPFQHDWYQDATAGSARRTAAGADAVIGLPLTMVQDRARLAVGYTELPALTRVAGVDDVFLAGAEVPGGLVGGKHASVSQVDVIAGL